VTSADLVVVEQNIHPLLAAEDGKGMGQFHPPRCSLSRVLDQQRERTASVTSFEKCEGGELFHEWASLRRSEEAGVDATSSSVTSSAPASTDQGWSPRRWRKNRRPELERRAEVSPIFPLPGRAWEREMAVGSATLNRSPSRHGRDAPSHSSARNRAIVT
jgi:hypothetical protein